MAQKAPGRSDREGMTTREALAMFPTDEARKVVRVRRLGRGPVLPHCGSLDTKERKKLLDWTVLGDGSFPVHSHQSGIKPVLQSGIIPLRKSFQKAE